MIIKNSPSRRKNLRRGYTLLEMIIVLGIISIIMGSAIYGFRKITAAAEMQRVSGDFDSIRSAIDAYKLNSGRFPTSQQGLKALVEKPTQSPVPSKWVKLRDDIPSDPWGNPYLYRFPGKVNKSEPEIYTFGPDGLEGTDDDVSSQAKK